jgi:hypothetical protein
VRLSVRGGIAYDHGTDTSAFELWESVGLAYVTRRRSSFIDAFTNPTTISAYTLIKHFWVGASVEVGLKLTLELIYSFVDTSVPVLPFCVRLCSGRQILFVDYSLHGNLQ